MLRGDVSVKQVGGLFVEVLVSRSTLVVLIIVVPLITNSSIASSMISPPSAASTMVIGIHIFKRPFCSIRVPIKYLVLIRSLHNNLHSWRNPDGGPRIRGGDRKLRRI